MRTFSLTDMGLTRKVNQDYVFTTTEKIGSLSNLFVVADGMGGHNAGDFASKFTVDSLVKYVSATEGNDAKLLLGEIIEKVNIELNNEANSNIELEGMGTTLVVATIVEDCLVVANIGDSRLYIINQEIEQITVDHSLVEEMVKLGEIDKETAKIHPDKNIITRAIGVGTAVNVDFFERKLSDNDMVLLCTDGLTNMVDDDEIKEILRNESNLSEKGKQLVDVANNNGGQDNIAVIIIEPFK